MRPLLGPKVHHCRRVACAREVADADAVWPETGSQPWCSPLCRRIDEALAVVPHVQSSYPDTAKAAVRHALPWLDVRAAREEAP